MFGCRDCRNFLYYKFILLQTYRMVIITITAKIQITLKIVKLKRYTEIILHTFFVC